MDLDHATHVQASKNPVSTAADATTAKPVKSATVLAATLVPPASKQRPMRLAAKTVPTARPVIEAAVAVLALQAPLPRGITLVAICALQDSSATGRYRVISAQQDMSPETTRQDAISVPLALLAMARSSVRHVRKGNHLTRNLACVFPVERTRSATALLAKLARLAKSPWETRVAATSAKPGL